MAAESKKRIKANPYSNGLSTARLRRTFPSSRMRVSRFVASSVLFLLLTTPLGAAAREWGLPQSGDVTRGTFIRAAVQALDVAAGEDGNLPYSRIPQALEKAIRSAHERGALTHFGNDLRLSQTIKRGEAVQVVVGLLRMGNMGDGDTNFRDVRDGTPLARAVDVAADEKWIVPQRATQFGIHKALTAVEAENLLRKASGRSGTQKQADDTVPTIRITIPKAKNTVKFTNTEVLDTIWQLINDEFLYRENINPEEASYSAIEGLVQSLKDPYTSFMRPAKAQDFRTQLKGEVTGIGAQVEDKNGILTIVTPLRGSPAEKAGLLPGDEILMADDVALTGIGFVEAVNKVRGAKGSTVKLRIRRDGIEFDVSVVRDVVTVPEIEITFQEGVAIVRIMQFGQITESKLRSEMEKVQTQNPKGVILDLRNNPGGLEHAATVVASNFLPLGSVVSIIKSKGGSEDHKTDAAPTIDTSVPVIVLINGGSASASEIVAGALQDSGRAKLVGEKTFGKGTVQAVLQFKDGSSLKMTVAEWLTPKKRTIDKTGIEPDVKVSYSKERDDQLLKALELLRR